MTDEFEKGDRVSWRSHGGTAEGVVVRKVAEDTVLVGREVRASVEEPQYLVRSDTRGADAVHEPSALRRS